MSKNIAAPNDISSPEALLRAICAPDILPDEDADSFAYLRQAMFQDLEPKSPYEQLLAEQMVALEWDTVRYRRLRDNLLRDEFRIFAKGALFLGRATVITAKGVDKKYEMQAQDLVVQDSDRRQSALRLLEDKEITPSEIMAKAYQNIAKDIEVFERQIAESETRRRKLREDYDRLRGSRPKQVEDAEVIEP